jgi:2-polyprenyl-6-methoxyphenol hydroxylase-like FAD-dependent oxidoreductase
MELFWFRLPRLPGDETEFDTVQGALRGNAAVVMNGPGDSVSVLVYPGRGFILGAFNRIDHWQMAYIYPPGRSRELRESGHEAIKRSILETEPRFARHVEMLTDWHQLSPLNVAFSRCRRWYRPGILLIGDAAHVMTPAAGAGIKYAIEDAVATANRLTAPLLAGRAPVADLAAVQRRREWPTRLMQTIGTAAQKNVLGRAIGSRQRSAGPARFPLAVRLFTRLPFVRSLPARFIAFGLWRERVADVW